MAKKLITLLILTLFIFSTMAVTAGAKTRIKDERSEKLSHYGFLTKSKATLPTISEYGNFAAKTAPATSLGYSEFDEGPGALVGTSWRDKQYHASAPRMIDWRAPSPRIHMGYTYQTCAGEPDVCSRTHAYNLYDPIVGTWPKSENIGCGLLVAPAQGTYVSLDVEPNNGGALVAGHISDDGTFTGATYGSVAWDATAGASIFCGWNHNALDLLLAHGDDGVTYPRVEHHIVGTDTATYMLSYEGVWDESDVWVSSHLEFWKKTGASSTTPGSWTMTEMATNDASGDEFWWDSWHISASRASAKVMVSFVNFLEDTLENAGSDVFYRVSSNMGDTWGPIVNITGYDVTGDVPGHRAWIESSCLISSDDILHVIWNGNKYWPPHIWPDSAAEYNNSRSCRLFHWSSGTGIISTVQNAEFDPIRCCGVGGMNVHNLARFQVSECAGRLYALWIQFGDPDNGDSTDCADYDAGLSNFAIGYNSDLYMAVATDLTGAAWDAARNITNTKTPDCGLDSCNSETMPSMARFGMDNDDWEALDWANAADAYTVEPGTHNNNAYLDVIYVDDHSPSAAMDNTTNPATWTYNPHKWFRLPCVDPVIKPIINVSQSDITYPFYIQHGGTKILKVPVENGGNDGLLVTVIDFVKTTYPSDDWLTIDKTSMTIDYVAPDNWDTLTVSLGNGEIDDPGTIVNLVGEIYFLSNDNTNDSVFFKLDFPVADTIIGVTWDTVTTGLVSLMIGSNGNVGGEYEGGVNLDYYNSDVYECDNEQNFDSSGTDTIPGDASIYLGDASTVILSAEISGSDTIVTANWSIFGDGFASPNGFKPVEGQIVVGVDTIRLTKPTHFSDVGYDCAHSGTFVTVDSTLAVENTYYAPVGDGQSIIKLTRIFSYDGAAHNGLVIGEAFDWDIPSDTGSYNKSSTEPPLDLIYQIGGEWNDPAGDSLECTDNDTRMGGAVRIGYYTQAEWNADSANALNEDPIYGGYAELNEDFVYPASGFVPIELYRNMLNNSGLNSQASSVVEDQHTVLTYFDSYDLGATDTLLFWTVMATIPPTIAKDEQDLFDEISATKTWLEDNLLGLKKTFTGCCIGFTGNANCSADENPDISDITRLIDYLYLSHAPLCCLEEADANASGGEPDISDITKLIDHLYLSHSTLPNCP